MNIISLSMSERGFLVSLAFINLAMITICFMMNIAHQRHKKHIILCFVVFSLNVLNVAGLMEINKDYWHELYDKMSPLARIINVIPSYFQYIFIVTNLGFVIYELYSIRKLMNEEFSISNVREAIENLPTGLAYYDTKGFLYLSNHIMHKLSIELTSKDLQNGLELKNDITLLQNSDHCIIKGDEPAFMINDGTIWQFSKSVIELKGNPYIELRADDITEIYHLSDEIREINERLRLEKIRLSKHMKNIGKYISEEENLRVKMAVHDDFGELIARTVRAYDRKATKAEKSDVINDWSKLNKKMSHILTFDKEKINPLDKVQSLAKELDCKITFIGTLPEEAIHQELILSATFESLKNAVHHAMVDEIIVTISQDHQKIVTKIYNEDKTNPKQIIEGGGLSTLRDKIEKTGGVMEIICNQGVTLWITLYKEVNIHV